MLWPETKTARIDATARIPRRTVGLRSTRTPQTDNLQSNAASGNDTSDTPNQDAVATPERTPPGQTVTVTDLDSPPEAARLVAGSPPEPPVVPQNEAHGEQTQELQEALLTLVQLQQQALRNLSKEDTKAEAGDPASDNPLNLHDRAYKYILRLCGLTEGDADEIPALWTHLADKGLAKGDKNQIIREALRMDTVYHGHRPPLVPQIVQMFRDRAFHTDYTSCTMATATRGLSPFIVNTLLEEEVAEMQEAQDALEKATSMSVADVTSGKLKAKIPLSFGGLVDVLKTYANLLEAGFGEMCPLGYEVQDLVNQLVYYSPEAKAAMSAQSKASIMWALLLQSRHFANGKMDGGPNSLTNQFAAMMNAIKGRQAYVNVEVPPALYRTKPKNEGQGNGGGNGSGKSDKPKEGDGDKPEKKFVAMQRPNQHPKLKEKLKFLQDLPRRPNMGQICKPCKIAPQDLFPDRPDRCIRAAILGWCHDKCPHSHDTVTDAEAEVVLEKLKPIIDNNKLITYRKVRQQ